MTKKDYILIANAFNYAKGALAYASTNAGETARTLEITAEILATRLKGDNARFDEKKFMTACGVNEEINTKPSYTELKKRDGHNLNQGLKAQNELERAY